MGKGLSTMTKAVVMNMFYTGLGIARSLGEKGIPVIGLTAHRGAYGNFTRYARVRTSPDSREHPEELLGFLLRLAEELGTGSVIFPTRDDDVLFLDRYRERLEPHFRMVLPGRAALEASLNKWATYRAAQAAGIAAPRCWNVTSRQDLLDAIAQLTFPCVLKPVSAHHWRKTGNWEVVGQRKAVAAASAEALLAEYDVIGRVERRALLQEVVPGGDHDLWIAACYMNRQFEFVAGFTAQKLLQIPEGFGTGCLVQSADCPQVPELAIHLLRSIGFSGIAEVEFKWDARTQEYKLIEINPRAWDQHRLGTISGIDLAYTAYCDAAGMPLPVWGKQKVGQKWIAEDVFFFLLLRALWRRDGSFSRLLRMGSGGRTYSIWSWKDPVPLIGFLILRYLPELAVNCWRYAESMLRRSSGTPGGRKAERYDSLDKAKN
jgi:D-aspartate ligase